MASLEDLLKDFLEQRSAVLVGVTGDGKSTLGNLLCGTPTFEVGEGFSSETQESKFSDYMFNNSLWRIVDTIGLHDTGLTHKEVMSRFSAFADLTPNGIDVFLFVVKFGRFKPEHQAALESFVANCGEAALRHTYIVFTHCSDQAALEKAMENPPPSLEALLPKVRGTIGVDSLDKKRRDDFRGAVHDAMDSVVSANDQETYSNEVLQAAREAAAAEEAEKERKEREAFQEAVNAFRNGTGPVTIEREEGVITRPAGSYQADEGAGDPAERISKLSPDQGSSKGGSGGYGTS